MKYLSPILAAAVFTSTAILTAAQHNERDRGIDLYRQGNYGEAVSVLSKVSKQKEFASDAEVLNYLGLAYLNSDDSKKARKTLEKAVKMQPQNSFYRSNLAYVYLLVRQVDKSQDQADKALQIDPSNVFAYYVLGTANLWEGKLEDALSIAEKMSGIDSTFAQAYILKSDVLIAKLGKQVAGGSTVKQEIDLLKQSVDALEKGVKNSQPNANRKGIEEKLEGMKVFYEHYSKDRTIIPGAPPAPEPGVTPVKIPSKPRATYTENARSAGAQGTIRLAILLGANGKVLHILKLKGLGYGLDDQAILAARQIRFQPKMKDGVPVSTVAIFEYGFNIY